MILSGAGRTTSGRFCSSQKRGLQARKKPFWLKKKWASCLLLVRKSPWEFTTATCLSRTWRSQICPDCWRVSAKAVNSPISAWGQRLALFALRQEQGQRVKLGPLGKGSKCLLPGSFHSPIRRACQVTAGCTALFFQGHVSEKALSCSRLDYLGVREPEAQYFFLDQVNWQARPLFRPWPGLAPKKLPSWSASESNVHFPKVGSGGTLCPTPHHLQGQTFTAVGHSLPQGTIAHPIAVAAKTCGHLPQ